MSDIKFSKEQLEAIKTDNSSLLVSAAAGSGKTAVLVERIIRHICDEKIDVDKLLVVTFTNAAAQGMKAKIKNELNKRIRENPKDIHLRRQLVLLNMSNISTVHAFCGKVIKKYNHLIKENIPVNYTLLEETERELIMQEVLSDVLDSYYDKDDEVFERCIESYSPGSSDDLFSKLIFNIYAYIISIPFYNKWISKILKQLSNNDSFYKSIYAKELLAHIHNVLESAIDKYEFALECISAEEGLLSYMDTFLLEMDYMKKALKAKDIEECLNVIIQITFERLKPAKRGTDNFIPKSIRDAVKTEIKEINSSFNSEIIKSSEGADSGIDLIEKIFEIIKEFDKLFKERKYEKNNLDFNDLEHFTISILCDGDLNLKSEVAKEMTEGFYEILVDEYQDTNDVQEALFKLISKNNNLFVVGDVKQSIYRFRHANPNLFINRLNSYKKDGTDSKLVFLNANYRCEDNIIKTVNHIFSYIMTEETSKIDYDKNDRLILGGNFPEDSNNKLHTEVSIAVRNEECEDDTLEALEAKMIGDRINAIIKDKDFFIEKDENKRNVTFSDITILLRSFNEKSLLFLSELSSAGIPVTYDDRTNFFETTEIKIFISILKIIDNPYDDISFISVLRNMFDFTDDELLSLRINTPKGKFYDAVLNEREHNDKISKIVDYLELLRSFSLKYELHTLIKKIYDDTFFIERQLSIVEGVKRKENLNQLVEIAKNFENTGFKGISAFISYMNKIIASERKIAKLSGGNKDGNSVKVMSIHKSKGLEFPIVIMAGLHKQINTRDLSNSIIINQELGIGFDYINLNLRCKYPTIYKKVVAIRELNEQIAEELRVLYVGMTRAQHKLILTGALKGKNGDFQKYAKMMLNNKLKLSYIDFTNIRTYFDMILPSLFYHKNLSEPRNQYLDNSFIKTMDFEIDYKEYRNDEYIIIEETKDADITLVKEKLKGELSIERIKEIDEFLSFKYEHKYSNIPQKVSVSELKGLYVNDEQEYGRNIRTSTYKPEFSENKRLTAAQRGTLIHYVFEHIDLKSLRNTDDIFGVVEKLYESNRYLKENLSLQDIKKVENYFKSSIGLKMLRSKEVYREKDFLIRMNINEVFDEFKDDLTEEKVIVQGIIDAYFVDNNNNVYLVDYKYVNKKIEHIEKEYKYQIELYKLALSKILNRKKESILAYIWDVNKGVFVKM